MLVSRSLDAKVGWIEVHYDRFADNPIKETGLCGGAIDMWGDCSHIGQDYKDKDYQGVLEPWYFWDYEHKEEWGKALKKVEREGGVVLSVTRRQDGSLFTSSFDYDDPEHEDGAIYITKEQITKDLGYNPGERDRKKKARKYLEAVIKEISAWSSGNVYCCTYFDKEGNNPDAWFGWLYAEDWEELLSQIREIVPSEYEHLVDDLRYGETQDDMFHLVPIQQTEEV